MVGLATETDAQTTGTVQFSANTYTVQEPDGTGNTPTYLQDVYQFSKTGGSGEAFLEGSVTDGSAVIGIDYRVSSRGDNREIQVSTDDGVSGRRSRGFFIYPNAVDAPNKSFTITITTVGSGNFSLGIPTTATIIIRDDDPTVVSLARMGTGTVNEGGTVEFTVTLGRTLVSTPNEIIDVPLIVSGTNITTADWSLAAKTGTTNTGVTLVNEMTAAPVVRFSGAGAQTATLILTAAADNTAETGGPETLTLALGGNDAFDDTDTRMTNVGGGADPNSNAANNRFNVTINDDMTAPVPAPLTAIKEQCPLRREDLPVPTATDNQRGTVRVTNNITNFPIASDTTIIWTYTDASNNTATQTQQVTIKDTMNPVPSSDNDLSTLTADCSIVADQVKIPTAMDNCDGRIKATANVSPPITASTTITWTYTDVAGNTATQTQEVTIADNIAPSPDPSNNLLEIMRQCSLEENELTTPAATDNCTGSVAVTNNIVNFPITSDTTITWTYTDAANNTATQTQQVIIEDTMAPIPAVADLPMLEDCSQITSLTVPTATDNCNAGTITATTDASFPITSTTTITWTYRDAAGNKATQTQEVICPLSATEDEAEVVIFPNPSGDYLEVRSSTGGVFIILSLSGKPLLDGTANTRVDVTSLQSGLYLVQLPDGRLLKFVRE